jgi:hypothetical protein
MESKLISVSVSGGTSMFYEVGDTREEGRSENERERENESVKGNVNV